MSIDRERPRFSRVLVSVISAALILALVVGAMPTSTALAAKCKFKHTVAAGETLISIAALYQVNWYEIAEANNLGPPYALAVGQILCITGGTKPGDAAEEGKKKTGKEPALYAVPGIGNMLVSVENFSPRTTYYVRLTPRGIGLSYRIGHFTTNKEGDFTGWIDVPGFVRRSDMLTVCVKNVWTDAVSCITVADLYLGLTYFSGSSCGRPRGR